VRVGLCELCWGCENCIGVVRIDVGGSCGVDDRQSCKGLFHWSQSFSVYNLQYLYIMFVSHTVFLYLCDVKLLLALSMNSFCICTQASPMYTQCVVSVYWFV
jgi:hypothetical protein